MKTILLLLLGIFIANILPAQVSKTINISSGGLSSALSETEKSTITNLIITGFIDARDFKTMRDEMLFLTNLDLSLVNITAYSGVGITLPDYHGKIFYAANTIAINAFFNVDSHAPKSKLSSVIIPTSASTIGDDAFGYCPLDYVIIPPSITTIGAEAFMGCSGLTSVTIPSTVKTIGGYAFAGCEGLKSINIQEGVTSIGDGVFQYCTSLKSISTPSTVINLGGGIFYDCNNLTSVTFLGPITSIGVNTFGNCSSLTSITIPPTVKSIEYWAFKNCSSLTTVELPVSVNSIGEEAFGGCSGLMTIYVLNPIPVDLSSSPNVFIYLDKTTCKLLAPEGSKNSYKAADQWKEFNYIAEGNGIWLSDSLISLESSANSTASAEVFCKIKWTASTNQTWLTVSPSTGTGDNLLTFSAEANPISAIRTAALTISASGVTSKSFLVIQKAKPPETIVSAGSLLSAFAPEELNLITFLTLSGTIDARDFKTMRDNMPLLAKIDLSDVVISAYTGTEGTKSSSSIDYMENEVPYSAFYSPITGGKTSLVLITLPSSVKVIQEGAFFGCTGLSTFIFPTSVTAIGNFSFQSCRGLTSVTIPSSVTYIGYKAFQLCYSLTSVNIPPSVTTIGWSAFAECIGLISVAIPPFVNSLQQYAFNNCIRLASIFAYSNIPIDLSTSPGVFQNVNKYNCKLYVPYGSKELYSTSNQWKDFTNIVEMAPNVGLVDLPTSDFIVYPNPTNSVLSFSTKNHDANRIEIFTTSGKVVFKENYKNSIDISRIEKGFYILKISDKNGNILKTEKIIKE